MPHSAIRVKVEDYLRKSQALAAHWQRPVTGEQLQAELDRMARHTQQPEMLRELWAALDNDAFLIAECLARPQVVDRLIRSWYAREAAAHEPLARRVREELDTRPINPRSEAAEWRIRRVRVGASPRAPSG